MLTGKQLMMTTTRRSAPAWGALELLELCDSDRGLIAILVALQ